MSLNFSGKYLCVGCGDDIHQNSRVRINCLECHLNFCPECFSSKVEVGQHRASHSYQFLDNGDFSPLNNNWSAKELVKLLDGLEQFGYGNWNDVSKYVASNKSALECRDAVNNILVSGPIGSLTYNETSRGCAKDHTSATTSNTAATTSALTGNLSLHQLLALGFMPARDDFELEHENEAEVLVSCIEAGGAGSRADPEDEELEVQLKLAHVEMYQARLKERERRKKVSKELALVSNFFKENPYNAMTGKLTVTKPKKKDSKTEFLEKMKFTASFQSIDEYKKCLAAVSKERELKYRIKELHRYRKNGISTLKEAESYEAERIKRNKKKADRKKALESGDSVGVESSPVKPELLDAVSGVDLDNITSIVGLPGYDVLSFNERRLCTSLRLHPQLYISYKTCLLRDHLQKKKGQSPKPVHPSGLDKVHRRKIFNFLIHSGWISAY